MPKLDKYLQVACEIYHYNLKKEPINYRKLVNSMSWCMSEFDVSSALDTLTDWLIIQGEYGSTGDGRACYLYTIDTHDGGDHRIEHLYEKYWKYERKNT
jgi:hypothetical protein